MSLVKNVEPFSGEQPDLFRQLEDHTPALHADNAPDFDLEDSLRITIKEMLRDARNRYGLSRDRIVERINLCLPETNHITTRKLNAWSAGSKEDHPVPAWVLPALCWACHGNMSPMSLLSNVLGLHLIDETEYLAAQLGRAVTDKAAAAKTEKLIKAKLGVYK
ncbi:MAG: hypothetical protein ACN4GR_16320 [Arenicellales bacterium]